MAEDLSFPRDELFERHFQHLPGPAYMWERRAQDFVLVAHNTAAAALPYSRPDAVLGMTAKQISSPDYAIDADLADCIASKQPLEREVNLFFSSTGTFRPVRLTLVPLSEQRVVVHCEDLAERERARVALDESERLYRTIVDNAHEGIWAVDAQGVTVYVNPRAAEMLGYMPSEMVGRPGTDFMFEEDTSQARDLHKRTEAGERMTLDFRLRHRNGATIWVAVSVAPVEEANGTVVGAVVLISDVTARRAAEQALRESESRLRALLNSHPDTIVRVTRDGVYLDAHIMERERHRVPFTAEQLLGQRTDTLFEPDFARRHAELRCEALDTGEIQLWEYERLIDGRTNYYEARFVPAGVDEVLITVRNVTDQKESENALRQLAARLEALTEAAFDGVCISEHGRIVEASDRFAKLLGYTPDELVGTPTSELLESPSLTTELDHFLRQRSGPDVSFGHHRDGSVLPLEICAATGRHADQRVYAIRDISTRKRLEQEIIDIGERERNRIGRDLHDGVGQILTGVSLATSSLAYKLATLDPELRKDAERITSTVQGAICEIRNIAKTLAPNIVRSGFRQALQRLANEVNRYTSFDCETEIDLSCEIADETVATHLYRIAQEGLQNAIRHSHGRHIELRCMREGKRLVLEIVDDGVGVPADAECLDGTGIKNMRYRARSLNGNLELRSGSEGGTRLVCRCFARPDWFR